MKNYYKLEPTKAQFFTTFTWLPYNFKFILGIMCDSIPICGSRKKGWIIIWSLISFVSSMICATVYIESSSAFAALVLLFNIGLCFNDVVVDSLMVI